MSSRLQNKPSVRIKLSLRTKIIFGAAVASILSTIIFISLFFTGNVATPLKSYAGPSTPISLSFKNPSLVSGTALSLNAVYKFANVAPGIDARMTIFKIYHSASVSNMDQPGSSTGYDPAFQPIVNFAAGGSHAPDTSYIDWKIVFKKAGTTTDTSINVAATAIDVDGNSNLRELVQAFTPISFATSPYMGTQLTISQNATSVTALAPTSDYNGIDTNNKSVMFQLNFSLVNTLTYRTAAINKNGATDRNCSIWFKYFFNAPTYLPVQMISFTGDVTDENKIKLNWSTASEENSDYFTLERSTDGFTFKEIGKVDGAGNSTQTISYSFIDNNPGNSNYYRLGQTDVNGHTVYSNAIVVNLYSDDKDLVIKNVSPVPFTSYLNISYATSLAVSTTFLLTDVADHEVKSVMINSQKGVNMVPLIRLESLRPGIYFITAVQNNRRSNTYKVVKR